MLKSKAWFVGVVVAVATAFPAPSVQASELVKLGKLLITGKRTPTTDARPVAEKPMPARQEATTERHGSAATRTNAEVMAEGAAAEDWSDRAAEQRQSTPPAAENVPRSGPPAAPQPGAGSTGMEPGF